MKKTIQVRTIGLAVLISIFLGYWLGGHKVILDASVKGLNRADANAILTRNVEFPHPPASASLVAKDATKVSQPVLEIMDPRWVKMAQYFVKIPHAIERAERAKNKNLDADNRAFLIALGLSDEQVTKVIELVHGRDLSYNKMTMQLMSEGDMPIETKRFRRELINKSLDTKNEEIAKELGGWEQFHTFTQWEESKPFRDRVAYVARSANLTLSPDVEQRIVTALINAQTQIAKQGTKTQPEYRASIMADQIRLYTSTFLSHEKQQLFIDHLNQ